MVNIFDFIQWNINVFYELKMFIYNYLVNKFMMLVCFSKFYLFITTYTKVFQKYLDKTLFPNECIITASVICRCGNKMIMILFQRMLNIVVFKRKTLLLEYFSNLLYRVVILSSILLSNMEYKKSAPFL